MLKKGHVLALTLDTYSNGQDLAPFSRLPDARWKKLSLAEGDSLIEFWVSVPRSAQARLICPGRRARASLRNCLPFPRLVTRLDTSR